VSEALWGSDVTLESGRSDIEQEPEARKMTYQLLAEGKRTLLGAREKNTQGMLKRGSQGDGEKKTNISEPATGSIIRKRGNGESTSTSDVTTSKKEGRYFTRRSLLQSGNPPK